MIIISIRPAKPFGAPSSAASCFLYHFAVPRTNAISRRAVIISDATFLVMDMSNGRTRDPSATLSTIFPSCRPSSARKRPSYSCPCSTFEDMNTCHPVLLCTMQGKGMVTWLPFQSVICHPYESPMCPKSISATSTSPSCAWAAERGAANAVRATSNMTFSHFIVQHIRLPC